MRPKTRPLYVARPDTRPVSLPNTHDFAFGASIPKLPGARMSRAPMRLLDRYICREVISHAFLGLAVFTFVFFVPQLVRLMELVVRHTAGFGNVALLFLCTIPPVLAFTLPMAVLVGVLIGLGRLSADSEIVAIHASGISLRRLLVPIGFVAAVTGVVTLATTFWLGPASWRTLNRLEARLLASQAPFRCSHASSMSDSRTSYYTCKTSKLRLPTGEEFFWLRRASPVRGRREAALGPLSARSSPWPKDAQVITGGPAGQAELHLGAAASTSTTRTTGNATTSPRSARATFPFRFCRLRCRRKIHR